MGETTNSIKDALKERISNPFLGKLLLAWIIWNWKVTYITFFVSEEKLTKNKLEYVSDYIMIDSFWGLLNIYFVPLLITAFLIWIVPWLSYIVYEVSENSRKKRALKKKKIDNEISGYKEEQILKLQSEISTLKSQLNENSGKEKELNQMAEYLSEEPDLISDINYDETNTSYLNKFRKEITEMNKKDKVFALIEGFHTRNSENYFNEIEKKDFNFLITYEILETEKNTSYLTKYGEFISKNMLYEKYSNITPNFNYNTLIYD